MTFILGMLGCSGKTYELPHGQFCHAYELPTDQTREFELKAEDKNYIIDLLNEGSWMNDLSNCIPIHRQKGGNQNKSGLSHLQSKAFDSARLTIVMQA